MDSTTENPENQVSENEPESVSSADSASAPEESYTGAAADVPFQMDTKNRINRKSCGLTYSAPVGENDNPILTREELLEQLSKKRFPPDRYLIAMEFHQNGKRHFHAYIEWDKKPDIKDLRYFDVFGVHPNVINVESHIAWKRYCMKHDEDYITNFVENPYKRALEADTDEEALNILWENVPGDMAKCSHNIERNIKRRRAKPPQPILYYGPFPEKFQIPEEVFQNNLSLVVRGDSGIGKTQWARYITSHLYSKVLYIKGSLQSLRHYNGEECIIFDDLTIHGDDVMKYNALLDVESGGSIRVLYGSVELPPGVKRIFLTNSIWEGGLRIPKIPALSRRYTTLYLSPDLSDEDEDDRNHIPSHIPDLSSNPMLP